MTSQPVSKGSKSQRKKIFRRIGFSFGISAVVFLGVVFSMVLFSETEAPEGNDGGLSFDTLQTEESKLPPLHQHTARDGEKLSYRYYEGEADKTLILLHGSAYHSSYLQPLASHLSENDVANVYTPDFRGHGPQTENRGEADYIGQLEDDINDFVKYIRSQQEGPLLLGGHSSGGGTVIRYAGGENEPVDGYLMLSPFIHHTAPTYRSDSEWSNVNMPRMIGLSILNTFGITVLNHKDVISFNMPEAVRDGTETLRYNYALQISMHARNDYGKDIASLEKPSFVMIGTDDHVSKPEAFKPLFNEYSPETKVSLLEDTSHFGVVTRNAAHKTIAGWLEQYDGP
ncbi:MULTISPECIES: alpha/beta hydrolase [Salimicrobium]|uniref:Lysophospholipase, alpha-beta hydrolase superfamily n=2 Tax=Salimicrobium TaxID=351195 RepID=A0ABY1KY91_9BACI|nr:MULTISPECIES: alpha/beta fold hydrolase [Salimicrobium]SDY26079.1 Lysophospholipase, alpha-beta hydrolase superfamily [Salimicrobium album]SIS93195.1 Lysophospholipase, alpha-beta hydrolase superfamily [Salimicrobium salexigens]